MDRRRDEVHRDHQLPWLTVNQAEGSPDSNFAAGASCFFVYAYRRLFTLREILHSAVFTVPALSIGIPLPPRLVHFPAAKVIRRFSAPQGQAYGFR